MLAVVEQHGVVEAPLAALRRAAPLFVPEAAAQQVEGQRTPVGQLPVVVCLDGGRQGPCAVGQPARAFFRHPVPRADDLLVGLEPLSGHGACGRDPQVVAALAAAGIGQSHTVLVAPGPAFLEVVVTVVVLPGAVFVDTLLQVAQLPFHVEVRGVVEREAVVAPDP